MIRPHLIHICNGPEEFSVLMTIAGSSQRKSSICVGMRKQGNKRSKLALAAQNCSGWHSTTILSPTITAFLMCLKSMAICLKSTPLGTLTILTLALGTIVTGGIELRTWLDWTMYFIAFVLRYLVIMNEDYTDESTIILS
jgi:hypothetical protein